MMNQNYDILIRFSRLKKLKNNFEKTLIIWAYDQHFLHYKCHSLMINYNKFKI